MNNLSITLQAATDALAQAATEASSTGFQFGIYPDKFLESLPIMGKGMLGIFIVTGIIVLIVGALNKMPEKKQKDED